jgi:hypothetical protein
MLGLTGTDEMCVIDVEFAEQISESLTVKVAMFDWCLLGALGGPLNLKLKFLEQYTQKLTFIPCSSVPTTKRSSDSTAFPLAYGSRPFFRRFQRKFASANVPVYK